MNTIDEKSSVKLDTPANTSSGGANASASAPLVSGAQARRTAQDDEAMQGEGNPKAAAMFNKAEQEFVAAGKVPAAARAAAPRSEAERQSMLAAEQAAKRFPRQAEETPKKSWSHLAKGPGKDAGEADTAETKR